MKKFTLMLFFFICINKVNAITYNIWQEEKINNDNLYYEEKNMYKWYKEEKEGEYLLFDINIDKYKYNDLNDTIYSNYTNWQDECIEFDYREIEYKSIYSYKELKKIRYIKIENISKNNLLNEIVIKSNDIDIKYTIKNYNSLYKDNYFKTSGYVILELDDYYSIENMFLRLNSDTYYSIYKIYLYNDLNKDYIAMYPSMFTNFENYVTSEWINKSNSEIYTNIITSDKEILKTDYNLVMQPLTQCRYRDILTFHYNINKVYYDNNYYEYIKDYIKDVNDYKTYYKYLNIEGKNNTNYDQSILKENIIINNKKTYSSNNTKELLKSKKKFNYNIVCFLILIIVLIFLLIKKRKNVV